MIEIPTILDLLKHRADVFATIGESLRDFKVDKEALFSYLPEAFEGLVNAPSFMLDIGTMGTVLAPDGRVLESAEKKLHTSFSDGRFNLPYGEFSVVLRHTNAIGPAHTVILYQRYDPMKDQTDNMMVHKFVKEPGVYGGKWFLSNTSMLFVGGALQRPHGMFIGVGGSEVKKMDEEWMQMTLNSHLMSIRIINSEKEFKVYLPASGTKRRTAMEAAKSKPSGWEYKLIKASQLRKNTEWQGGHHATPKRHPVKGHPRTYKHERYVNVRGQTKFVPPFERGDASKGYVSHDYVVTINDGGGTV